MLFLNDLIDKGGIVMIILLLLSVIIIAVIIYKFIQFILIGNIKDSFILDILSALESKQLKSAIKIAKAKDSPLARIIEVYLNNFDKNKLESETANKQIQMVANLEMRPFEKFLNFLEMSATIAPLLGLLGTVIGMVKSFANIDKVGTKIDPSMLAGGIWEALLTTVAGLCVAIPALVAHYYFTSRIDSIKAKIEESLVRINNQL